MSIKLKLTSVMIALLVAVGFSAGNASADTLVGLQITHPATKLTYTVGDSLDISGLVVSGVYLNDDGDEVPAVVTVTEANISGFDSTAPADNQVLTVTVGAETATYEVDVVPAPTLVSIEITSPANVLSYTVGGSLDITGLQVTGTYMNNDGDEYPQAVAVTGSDISGFDSSAATTSQVLTITVDGKTATYTVDIVAAPVVVVPNTSSSGGSGGSGGGFRGNIGTVLGTSTSSVEGPAQGRVLGASTFNFGTNLRYLSRGNDVVELQNRLKAEGFFTYPTSTGYFGTITLDAVKKYQVAHHITPVSGFVGPLTRAELNK